MELVLTKIRPSIFWLGLLPIVIALSADFWWGALVASQTLLVTTAVLISSGVFLKVRAWWTGRSDSIRRDSALVFLSALWMASPFLWNVSYKIDPTGMLMWSMVILFAVVTVGLLFATSDSCMDRARFFMRLSRTNPYGRSLLLKERRNPGPSLDPIQTVPVYGKWLLSLAGLVLVGIAVWAFVALPQCLIESQFPTLSRPLCSPSDKSGMTEEAYRSLLSSERQSVLWLLGGLLAVLTLVLTFRRDEVVRSDYRLSMRNHELERDTNTTNRYTSALEHLGKNNEVEQVGAIYALLRIARESVADREAIAKLLAAYIKECLPRIKQNDDDPEDDRTEIYWEGLASLVQKRWELAVAKPQAKAIVAVQTLVLIMGLNPDSGHNPEEPVAYALDLDDAFLNLADFRNADLGRSSLRNAQLEVADLQGADLSATKLFGANLRGSMLMNAKFPRDMRQVTFDFAQLTGCNLQYANLTGASFINADLRAVNMQEVTGLTSEQILEAACWNSHTEFPDYLNLPSRKTAVFPEGMGKYHDLVDSI
jgi:hypothetical protein